MSVAMVEEFIDELSPEQKRWFAAIKVPLDENRYSEREETPRFASIYQVLSLDLKKNRDYSLNDKLTREQYKSCAVKLDKGIRDEDCDDEELFDKESPSDDEDFEVEDEEEATELLWEIFNRQFNRKVRKPLSPKENKRAIKCILAGADLNSKNEMGLTPLHFIIMHPSVFHRDLFFAMMGQGANLSELISEDRTVLDVALNLNNEVIAAALLDFPLYLQLGEIPLKDKGIIAYFPPLITQKIRNYCEKSTFDKLQKIFWERTRFEQLLTAVRTNDTKTIKQLLAAGVDINCANPKCLSLIEAVTHNTREAMEILLQAKADFKQAVISDMHPQYKLENSRDDFSFIKERPEIENGISVLQYAINLKYSDMIKIMLNHGLAPSAEDLLVAIQKKDIEIARLLLEAGAPIAKINDRKFGLIYAAMWCLIDIVPDLLEYGANIDEPSPNSKSTVDFFEFRTGSIANPVDCLFTKFLIIYGADPKLGSDLFFTVCNNHIIKQVRGRFPKIDFNQASEQTAKVIWENRSLLPKKETLDLFELINYRKVLDHSLNPKNISLLLRYAELEYFNLWKDLTLQQRGMCYLMFKVMASEAAAALCQAYSKHIEASLQKLGIPNNSATDKALKEHLQSILENLLRSNLSPVRAFTPIIRYEQSLRLYHVYQALPTVVANLVKGYLGFEAEEYLSHKAEEHSDSETEGHSDSEAEEHRESKRQSENVMIEKPVYPSLEVPLISFGRFNGAAIVDEVRKLEKARLEAVERVFGASLEKTITLTIASEAFMDGEQSRDKKSSDSVAKFRHKVSEEREQLIEKLGAENSKVFQLQELSFHSIIAVLDVLSNQLASKIENLTEISQQLEECEGLSSDASLRTFDRLKEIVALTETLNEVLPKARKFATQIKLEKPETLKAQLQSLVTLKDTIQAAIESNTKYIKQMKEYIERGKDSNAFLIDGDDDSAANSGSKVVAKKLS